MESVFPVIPVWMSIVLPIVVIWSLAWKGVALWRAGRNGHLVWFIVLLILNTVGILEIIYIFAFSRKK
jgi:methionyl-tRNA synthetase